MTAPEHGIEYLDVRNMWKDEAIDFTPWLADHLDMLNDALGVTLELVQKEKPVGPFYCDILAREVGSGVKAAIENQLALTDHSHLGQLLTYAAGLDSLIAVWVAPDFLYEHAKALHRLNKSTRDEFRFYGVKVTLQRSGDAPPVPCLRPVVTPAGWNEDLSLPQGAVDPRKQQFHAFFQPIIDTLFKARFADTVPRTSPTGASRAGSSRTAGATSYAVAWTSLPVAAGWGPQAPPVGDDSDRRQLHRRRLRRPHLPYPGRKPAVTDDRIRSLVTQGEYYATMTWHNLPDLRRVRITWMRTPERYPGMPFNQQMTVPSELSLHTTEEGPRLRMLPATELESLRTRSHEWSDVPLHERDNPLAAIDADLLDLETEFQVADGTVTCVKLRGFDITYDADAESLTSCGTATCARWMEWYACESCWTALPSRSTPTTAASTSLASCSRITTTTPSP